MPPDYKEGSTIYPMVQWLQEASDQVTFKVIYDWGNPGGGTSTKTGTLTMATNLHAYTSGSIIQETYSGTGITATSPSNRQIRSRIKFTLYRHDNVYTGDAITYALNILYERDTLGSRTYTTK